ncbi:hypothetical protein AN641_01640 [Candidatus Epulonipiscioides gigas]|nr:hypothetical protein AN641_01640 [Epulopiscium sp. SCG-C07WGA-EpuloA2]
MSTQVKKRMAECLALSIGLSVVGAPQATTYAKDSIVFTDIGSHWASPSILLLNEIGILSGYNDGTFRPNNFITRAEIASCLQKIFGYTVDRDAKTFDDVEYDEWYAGAILAMSNMMNSYGGDFKPNNFATREEVAFAIAQSFGMKDYGITEIVDIDDKFIDAQKVSYWAKSAVEMLVAEGYMSGRDDGTIDPKGKITRGELASILDRITAEFITTSGVHTLDRVQGNLIINQPNVHLKNTRVDGNIYLTNDIGDSNIKLDNIDVNGTVFVQGGKHNLVLEESEIDNMIVDKNGIFIETDAETEIKAVNFKSQARFSGDANIETALINAEEVELEKEPDNIYLKDAYKVKVADINIYDKDIDKYGNIIRDYNSRRGGGSGGGWHNNSSDSSSETIVTVVEQYKISPTVTSSGDVEINTLADRHYEYKLAPANTPTSTISDNGFKSLNNKTIPYSEFQNYGVAECTIIIRETTPASNNTDLATAVDTYIPVIIASALKLEAYSESERIYGLIDKGIQDKKVLPGLTAKYTLKREDEVIKSAQVFTFIADPNNENIALAIVKRDELAPQVGDTFTMEIDYPDTTKDSLIVASTTQGTLESTKTFVGAPKPILKKSTDGIKISIPRDEWDDDYIVILDDISSLDVALILEEELDLTQKFIEAYDKSKEDDTYLVVEVTQKQLNKLQTEPTHNGYKVTVSSLDGFVIEGSETIKLTDSPTQEATHEVELGKPSADYTKIQLLISNVSDETENDIKDGKLQLGFVVKDSSDTELYNIVIEKSKITDYSFEAGKLIVNVPLSLFQSYQEHTIDFYAKYATETFRTNELSLFNFAPAPKFEPSKDKLIITIDAANKDDYTIKYKINDEAYKDYVSGGIEISTLDLEKGDIITAIVAHTEEDTDIIPATAQKTLEQFAQPRLRWQDSENKAIVVSLDKISNGIDIWNDDNEKFKDGILITFNPQLISSKINLLSIMPMADFGDASTVEAIIQLEDIDLKDDTTHFTATISDKDNWWNLYNSNSIKLSEGGDTEDPDEDEDEATYTLAWTDKNSQKLKFEITNAYDSTTTNKLKKGLKFKVLINGTASTADLSSIVATQKGDTNTALISISKDDIALAKGNKVKIELSNATSVIGTTSEILVKQFDAPILRLNEAKDEIIVTIGKISGNITVWDETAKDFIDGIDVKFKPEIKSSSVSTIRAVPSPIFSEITVIEQVIPISTLSNPEADEFTATIFDAYNWEHLSNANTIALSEDGDTEEPDTTEHTITLDETTNDTVKFEITNAYDSASSGLKDNLKVEILLNDTDVTDDLTVSITEKTAQSGTALVSFKVSELNDISKGDVVTIKLSKDNKEINSKKITITQFAQPLLALNEASDAVVVTMLKSDRTKMTTFSISYTKADGTTVADKAIALTGLSWTTLTDDNTKEQATLTGITDIDLVGATDISITVDDNKWSNLANTSNEIDGSTESPEETAALAWSTTNITPKYVQFEIKDAYNNKDEFKYKDKITITKGDTKYSTVLNDELLSNDNNVNNSNTYIDIVVEPSAKEPTTGIVKFFSKELAIVEEDVDKLVTISVRGIDAPSITKTITKAPSVKIIKNSDGNMEITGAAPTEYKISYKISSANANDYTSYKKPIEIPSLNLADGNTLEVIVESKTDWFKLTTTTISEEFRKLDIITNEDDENTEINIVVDNVPNEQIASELVATLTKSTTDTATIALLPELKIGPNRFKMTGFEKAEAVVTQEELRKLDMIGVDTKSIQITVEQPDNIFILEGTTNANKPTITVSQPEYEIKGDKIIITIPDVTLETIDSFDITITNTTSSTSTVLAPQNKGWEDDGNGNITQTLLISELQELQDNKGGDVTIKIDSVNKNTSKSLTLVIPATPTISFSLSTSIADDGIMMKLTGTYKEVIYGIEGTTGQKWPEQTMQTKTTSYVEISLAEHLPDLQAGHRIFVTVTPTVTSDANTATTITTGEIKIGIPLTVYSEPAVATPKPIFQYNEEEKSVIITNTSEQYDLKICTNLTNRWETYEPVKDFEGVVDLKAYFAPNTIDKPYIILQNNVKVNKVLIKNVEVDDNNRLNVALSEFVDPNDIELTWEIRLDKTSDELGSPNFLIPTDDNSTFNFYADNISISEGQFIKILLKTSSKKDIENYYKPADKRWPKKDKPILELNFEDYQTAEPFAFEREGQIYFSTTMIDNTDNELYTEIQYSTDGETWEVMEQQDYGYIVSYYNQNLLLDDNFQIRAVTDNGEEQVISEIVYKDEFSYEVLALIEELASQTEEDDYSINNDVAHEKLPSMGYIIEDLANTDFRADERIEEYLEQDDSSEDVSLQHPEQVDSLEDVSLEQPMQMDSSEEAATTSEQPTQIDSSEDASLEEDMYQDVLDDELFQEIEDLIEDLFGEKPIEEEPILDELILEIPDLDIVLE